MLLADFGSAFAQGGAFEAPAIGHGWLILGGLVLVYLLFGQQLKDWIDGKQPTPGPAPDPNNPANPASPVKVASLKTLVDQLWAVGEQKLQSEIEVILKQAIDKLNKQNPPAPPSA